MGKEEIEKLIKEGQELSEKLTTAIEAQKKEETKQLSTSLPTKKSTVVGRTSDEERAMKAFGVSHPAKLLEINTGAKQFKHVSPELKHIVRALKVAVDDSRMIAQKFYGDAQDNIGANDSEDRIARVKSLLESPYARDQLVPRLKAFGTDVVGGGKEWVPTLISSQYIEEYELDRVVPTLFRDVPMPSALFDLPVQNGVKKARQIGQGAVISPVNFGTTSIRLESRKLGEYYELPDELDQDSAPPIFALARQELIKAHVRAEEYMIVRGARTGTHFDADTAAAGADVAEKTVDGLVKLALLNSANGGTYNINGPLTEASLKVLKQRTKKFGTKPSEGAWIIPPTLQASFLSLPSVITIDKMGPLATVLTGQIASYQGSPVIVSEAMREDLNATGVYDGTTTNLGSIIYVNTTRFYNGIRRAIKTKIMESMPNSDVWQMAAYQRRDFKGHAQSALETSVVYGYNVTL